MTFQKKGLDLYSIRKRLCNSTFRAPLLLSKVEEGDRGVNPFGATRLKSSLKLKICAVSAHWFASAGQKISGELISRESESYTLMSDLRCQQWQLAENQCWKSLGRKSWCKTRSRRVKNPKVCSGGISSSCLESKGWHTMLQEDKKVASLIVLLKEVILSWCLVTAELPNGLCWGEKSRKLSQGRKVTISE